MAARQNDQVAFFHKFGCIGNIFPVQDPVGCKGHPHLGEYLKYVCTETAI